MSYSFFAEYYDKLTVNADYKERADYLSALFEKHCHRPGLTLDLACGTGNMTVELRKRGWDIFGADASMEMLTIAQSKAAEQDMDILFLNQKMQELELFGTIDSCICTLDSINHITSKRELQKAFERVSAYLVPGGLFVFDANTVYKHSTILGDNCYIYDLDEVFCAWQNNYIKRSNKVIITLDFFERNEDNSYSRSSEQFSERAYTFEELKEMLEASGMKIEGVYNDLTFDPPEPETQREIYVIRKEK